MLPVSTEKQLFYCQNPNQSGDTFGVGVALALFPKMCLMFFGSSRAREVVKGFLVYYYDMIENPKRLFLVIGDEDSASRDPKDALEEEDVSSESSGGAIG